MDKVQAIQEQLNDLRGDGKSAWAAAPSTEEEIKSVSIPISVPTQFGKVRCYLELEGHIAKDPNKLLGAIESLVNKGYPIDAWNSNNNGNSWGSSSRGKYNGRSQGRWT